ncbi:MAG: MFS transporter [Neisseriales bacterium]|nr:MAG: MFS transporter [Neisseriales bacterium]
MASILFYGIDLMYSQFSILLNKRLLLVLSGIVCEYFLFTTFILLSKTISADLLPKVSELGHQLFTISVLCLAGLSRPLGGILFSSIGDSPMRHRIFNFSSLVMAISSMIIACLPNAIYFGFWAPIILLFIRMCQGIVIGAVIPEAIIYCYEQSDNESKLFTTNLANMATGCGFLLAMLSADFMYIFLDAHSWRYIMFAVSAICLLLFIMTKSYFISTTKQKTIPTGFHSIRQVLRLHKWEIIRLFCFGTFLTSGGAVFFYIMPDFLAQYFHYSWPQTRIFGISVVVAYMIGMIVAVFFHECINKNFYISSGFVFKAILVFVFHSYVTHDFYEVVILSSFCCFMFGFFIAKLPVMMIASFPPHLRYAGVSLVYNVSFGIMFGLSQYIIGFLIQKTHSLYMPSMYIIFFSYVSLISLWFMSKDTFYSYHHKSDSA